MSFTRSTRLARLAACTALALSAGALLGSAPAGAAGPPVPAPAPAAASAAGTTGSAPRPTAAAPRTAPARAPYATPAARPLHDYDGDGLGDVLYRGLDERVLWFPSRGGGRVELEVAGSGPGDPAAEVFKDLLPVGDLGGDGRPELLTLSVTGRLSLVSVRAGGRSTGARRWSGTGWQAYNKVLSPGDLTRDGRPDLLARTPAGDLFLYRSTGRVDSDPFGRRIRVGGGWGAYDQLVGAGDLDRDGTGDLLARNLAGDLYFYKGTGSATVPFRTRVKVGPGWNAYNEIAGADDLDGDGRADLLARDGSGRTWWYLSTGGGRFGPRGSYGAGWQYVDLMPGGGGVRDYGKHQVLGVTRDGRWFTYRSLADGRFTPRREIDAGSQPLPSGTRLYYAAAMNDRRRASLVVLQDARLYVDDGLAARGWTYRLTAGPGDLTGDGRGDLVGVDAAGRLVLYPGDGAVASKLGAPVRVGGGWGGYDALAGAGDCTGDGRADLLARDRSGRLYLYAGTGSAAAPFGGRVLVGSGWGGYDALAGPGDLTGDGRADLVARDRAGVLWAYAATGHRGTAAFGPRTRVGGGWGAYRFLI
ncbi:FG-GAP-like repeat-containing protein [Streptomyces sp. NRRL S-87]|uniref:FG-GAP-like repeat-containing protein n=1 Tax=Streptomyces sp. NRRL S-87 TaxID=1463920 RepID=UPI0004C060A0|nr:FG-GAP-like repeat-containing protein [Streptomyces sp. NRRL S-87]